jgi:indole-3-acetate monooxygenase
MAHEALARAEAAAQRLAGRQAEIEALRRLPDDVAGLLTEQGLMDLLTPASLGGPELHPATFFRVIERLAQADASCAWVSFISCTTALVAAYLPAKGAQALFARPGLRCAGVFAPRGQAVRVEGGYRVSGRWAWGSGVHHAHLVSVGCLVPGSDGRPEALPSGAPRVLSVVLPRSAVQPLDNWTSVGLAGTGSGEFDVKDAFVPGEHTACLLADAPLPRPLYRFPVFGLLALAIAAVSSGIARLAIDSLVDVAGGKRPQGSSRTLAERGAVQLAVAEAESEWRSARAFAFEAVQSAWGEAEALGSGTGHISVAARRDMRLASTHLVHTGARIVDRMFTLAGGTAVFAASPLQRCLRDAHVATQHMMVGEATHELAGRLLLGLPAATEML